MPILSKLSSGSFLAGLLLSWGALLAQSAEAAPPPAVVATPPTAENEDVGRSASTAESGHWQFQLTPYVWAIGADGRMALPGTSLPSVHVRRSFGDILKDLDGALFVVGTARRNRWVLAADYAWSRQTSHARIAGLLDTSSRLQLSTGTLALGYSVVDQPQWRLDIMGGVRGWDTRLSQEQPALGLSGQVRERWLDPVVAAKLSWRPSTRWTITAYGDVGVGGGARSTQQYYLVGNYQLAENWSVSLGYRYLAVDYDRSPLRLDVALHGWLAGLSYRF